MGAHSEGIRIGLVGVGYWGSKHLRVLRATTGLATVVGVDQRFTGNDDIPEQLDFDVVGYSDIERALPNVDAVVIATPPSTHARLSLQAIEAGKHVLVEKPLATTSAEAQVVVDAAESVGLVLMAGHTLEHNAAVHKLRDLVQGGELGDLYYLDCARLNLGLYQTDVNVIMDLAPHDISVANFVLGSRLTAVTAWGGRHVHPDFGYIAHLLLEYGDLGVRASIQVSWLSPQKVRRVTAVTRRSLRGGPAWAMCSWTGA